MLDMVMHSAGRFFTGQLFSEPAKAYPQLVIGVVLTALLFWACVALLSLPWWAAALIAGFVGGIAQPILFKDLRYR